MEDAGAEPSGPAPAPGNPENAARQCDFGFGDVFAVFEACFADLAGFAFFCVFALVAVFGFAGAAAMAGAAIIPRAAREAIRLVRFTVILLESSLGSRARTSSMGTPLASR
jgi:hypothetical protein